MQYDAWGKRTLAENNSSFTSYILDRGYTGHEHLDQFGLINMNGRMYDQLLGTMLSPDNYIQNTGSTQGFNRYSYVLNNPLKYTDPDGNWGGWDDLIVGGIGFAFGYVSYGIMNNDWGWNAVGSGALSAGAFLLGYYTAGAGTASYGSIAGGFSAAGLQGSANTVGLAYAGGMVATSTISSFMPPVTVPIGNNFSVSMSPAFAFSPSGFSAGANISATYNTGDWALSGGYGVNSTGYRLSGGGSYYDRANNQYWSGYYNYFGGKDAQSVWQAGWKKNDWSVSFTDDVWLGGDRYRTVAAEVGWNNYSLGMSLYTNDPGTVAENDWSSKVAGRNPRNIKAYNEGKRIYSGLYVGYRNGNMVTRMGIDAPFVQDVFQNGFHYVINKAGLSNSPYIQTDYGTPASPYFYRGSYNPFTLY